MVSWLIGQFAVNWYRMLCGQMRERKREREREKERERERERERETDRQTETLDNFGFKIYACSSMQNISF